MSLTSKVLQHILYESVDPDKLNPDLWVDGHLRPEVEEALKKIVEQFLDTFTIELNVDDVNIIGSNAGYNYKSKSDIDLHIITDYSSYPAEIDIMDELFQAKKNNFNNNYDIKIHDNEVELFIEDSNHPAESNGRYSIMTDEWLQEPEWIEEPEVNQELYQEYVEKINNVEYDSEAIGNLIDEIWDRRKESIAQDGFTGEFNLVFKKLRANGYLDSLRQTKFDCVSKELSV